MKKMIRLYIVIVSCLCFVACDMRELCYDHNEHAYKYQVNIVADYEQEWQYPTSSLKDWKENWPDTFNISYSDLRPNLPSGLRILLYDSLYCDKQNISRTGGIVYLTELEKSILLYNNDTETILFDNVEDYEGATATTRSVTRGLYEGNSYSTMSDVNAKTEPEVLYVSYIQSYVPVSAVTAPILAVSMKPVVYTYYVRYEFEYGIQHVVLARGALAGMAGSVNLHTQKAGDDLSTVMFDAKIRSFGVDAQVRSFGLPNDMTRIQSQLNGDYTCALNLDVALENGYIKTFEFDVTDQILVQPKGGVLVVKGLRVEDEEAAKQGTGFDVDVDNWGEYRDIIVEYQE